VIKHPEKLRSLIAQIRGCLDSGKYLVMPHARTREKQRKILRSEVIYVLRHGYHEKRKDKYDAQYQAWNYALRGYTIDRRELRIVVSFDDDRELLIITVIDIRG
jgi:hypothetical protein